MRLILLNDGAIKRGANLSASFLGRNYDLRLYNNKNSLQKMRSV